MRRFLIFLITAPLLIIIAIALLVPLLVDKDKVIELAAAELNKQTGATLRVEGESSLSILPVLGVKLERVYIDMADAEQGGLEARALEIGVQIMPLLSRQIAIDTVAMDGVIARMTTAPAPEPLDTSKMDDAQLQAFYARRQAERDEAGKAAGTEAALAVPLALEVADLRVTDSRLEMTEAGGKTDVIVIQELRGKGLNLDGRAMPLEGVLQFPGETPVIVSLQGEITLSQQTQQLVIQSMDVEATGVLAETIKLSTSGNVDIARQVADLQILANIADTTAQGALRYASFESPQIDADLHLNQFTPALLALAGTDAAAADAAAAGAAAADSKQSDTQASSDKKSAEEDIPLPLDALRVMDTRAKLRIDEVVWGMHRVTDLNARLRVLNGAAILPSVTGTVHDGKLNLKANLNAKHSLARLNTQGTLLGVDISKALAAAEVEPMLRGRADLNWKLNARGNSSNALTNTLRGPIELTTEEAVLQGMGVEKMLCEAVALINQEALSAEFPEESAFEALSVNIQMGDGKARLQPLKAKLANVRLLGKGALEIDTMDFKTTFTATLSPGLAKLDPACRVNERITDIDWPVVCRGNVAGEPAKWCSVDSSSIIEDVAEGELKRAAQKEVEDRFGDEAGEALRKLLGN